MNDRLISWHICLHATFQCNSSWWDPLLTQAGKCPADIVAHRGHRILMDQSWFGCFFASQDSSLILGLSGCGIFFEALLIPERTSLFCIYWCVHKSLPSFSHWDLYHPVDYLLNIRVKSSFQMHSLLKPLYQELKWNTTEQVWIKICINFHKLWFTLSRAGHLAWNHTMLSASPSIRSSTPTFIVRLYVCKILWCWVFIHAKGLALLPVWLNVATVDIVAHIIYFMLN